MDAVAACYSYTCRIHDRKYANSIFPSFPPLNFSRLVVLQLRLYAMYGGSNKVMMPLMCMFFVSTVIGAVLVGIDLHFATGLSSTR